VSPQELLGDILDGSIAPMIFSPDGQRMISAGADKVQIWNAANWEALTTLSEPQYRIRSIAYSLDRTIKLWDVSSGKEVKTWRGHTDWVWAVRFGQDDRTIISASDDRTILVWDTQTNESQLIQDAQAEWIWAIASHPHLPPIAIAGSNPQIELWSLNPSTIQTLLNGHAHRIRSLAQPLWIALGAVS
jgi:WD40 repeat protein